MAEESKETINTIDLNEIVKIEQMPKVFEQLELIGEFIDNKLKDIDKLTCTEENKKIVKDRRAEISNTLTVLEDKRKEIKNKINEPYDIFNDKYEKTIKGKLEEAKLILTNKINKIEDEQKLEKKNKIEKYFNEYAEFKNIDFVKFEQANLNITLSVTEVKLQEQVKAFLDKIADDLELITNQEYSDEILIEYKKTLNVASSINSVIIRHKELEELKKKEEIKHQQQTQLKENVEKIDKALSTPVRKTKKEENTSEELYEVTFTVKGTKNKLIELKNFLKLGGYDYE